MFEYNQAERSSPNTEPEPETDESPGSKRTSAAAVLIGLVALVAIAYIVKSRNREDVDVTE